MSDVVATVDTYLAAWNETDPARRKTLIESAWATDGRYIDPLLESEGHSGISAMVAGVHEHYQGHKFRRTSEVDAHHDLVRFGWELAAPDGSVTVAGIDIGELDGKGKLRRITGFFGELPEEVGT